MSHPVQVGVSISLEDCKEKNIIKAGRIKDFYEQWTKITSDKWVLNCVRGLTIPFLKTPIQVREPFPFRMGNEETIFVNEEIKRLLSMEVLKIVHEEEGQWISNIFLRPKPNGKFRMILDLTELNKLIHYEHFKMFNLRTALDLLDVNMWMASADLTDAYYSVPIKSSQKKFLRFRWRGMLLEYQVLPNGLSPGPRIFTKLLKPIYAKMGNWGHICFPYLDDSFVVGSSKKICLNAIQSLVKLLERLGFVINKEKSVLKPIQKITFLGFELDSTEMMVNLTSEKKEKFKEVARKILLENLPIIRDVAGLVGLMVAYSPAVEYSGVHFKTLEKDKIKALKRSKGDFEENMWISEGGRTDIVWWLNNLELSRKIRRDEPDFELFTDASHLGWGAHTEKEQTGGRWHPSELMHINALELKAIHFGLKSLCKNSHRQHIRIRTDNTTALAYIKNMGGTKSEECQKEALSIWEWAQKCECWLTITHIPGVENVLADLRSRKFADHLEWSLSVDIFEVICQKWGTPEIDMFASRLNAKVQKYVSWEPEPDNWKTDAFSFKWDNLFIFCFPPYSLLPRVVRKLRRDRPRAIVVAPHWPAQPWHPLLQGLAKERMEFPKTENNLSGADSQHYSKGSQELRKIRLTAYLF